MAGTQYTGPMRLAHKGVVQAAPENTLGAFEAARDLGLEGIELDVRTARDGEAVVVHDDNLTKLTLGHPTRFSTARIDALDWEALSRVEIPYANHLLDDQPPPGADNELIASLPLRVLGQEHGRGYAESLARDGRMASLMRLDDFLQWLDTCAPGMTAEIEIKAPGTTTQALRCLDRSPAAGRCILFAGEAPLWQEIQRECARQGKPHGLHLGANIRSLNKPMMAEIHGMDLYEVGLNDGQIRPADVAYLHDRGIRVFSNLGDYPAWWEAVNRLEIAGFKTNYAQAYTRWAGGQKFEEGQGL